MKILVLSDSHGRDEYVFTILSENLDADVIIHLGDGAENDFNLAFNELPQFKSKPCFIVKGNCDFFSDFPTTLFENIGNHKFYITHGFAQHVKSGTDYLVADALKNQRDIALFGHTHTPYYKEKNELKVFNPGAVMNGYYGIITIDSNGSTNFEHCSL